MQDELRRAAFDFDRPRLDVAWQAFKAFIRGPMSGHRTVTIGVACEHYGDRDNILWLEFVRQLEDESTGIGENCGAAFTCVVPPDMINFSSRNWWSAEHGTLEGWITEVESMSDFKRCLAIKGWTWRGYSA